MKGATTPRRYASPQVFGFNPHAHEGRDILFGSAESAYMLVSIHTPMKGATKDDFKYRLEYDVSIHTPMKGATISSIYSYRGITVSIHTPMKGATAITENHYI